MKIDSSKVKKYNTEVSRDCKELIDKLRHASTRAELHMELLKVQTQWNFGKSELCHWAEVLDIFDEILSEACSKSSPSTWCLNCDKEGNSELKDLVISVLNFTSLLFEHSFSRHLYSSVEHLITLLETSDPSLVVVVLNLLYVFSKRSNYIAKIPWTERATLISRLQYLVECWGSRNYEVSLSECCEKADSYRSRATTLHFEYFGDESNSNSATSKSPLIAKKDKDQAKHLSIVHSIHIEHVNRIAKSPGAVMDDILVKFNVPKDRQMRLFTQLRMAHSFGTYEKRLACVMMRLQAISVLIYANSLSDTALYPGFIDECISLLKSKNPALKDIKTEVLKTLTCVIYLERHPKLYAIVEAAGANAYHGFLPSLVRQCIQDIIDSKNHPAMPHAFATALFSFLYHFAGYEQGAEAFVASGLIESLLNVISFHESDDENVTFVTRSVRVVDLITNIDVQSFQSQQGMQIIINRLVHEVSICRKLRPYELKLPPRQIEAGGDAATERRRTTSDQGEPMDITDTTIVETSLAESLSGGGTSSCDSINPEIGADLQCFHQRAALIKSLLNFLKKVIQEAQFADAVRHIMEGPLPSCLCHIISNPHYYGPSLFLLAINVVTLYIFQEPSQLSLLQDKRLTDIVIDSLLVKDIPASKEILAALPNVFSALCLNQAGLNAFIQCKPFDKLFKVLLSHDYLSVMKRKRNSDPLGDTASNLGTAIDELMRHQPTLKQSAMQAVVKILEELVTLGTDPKYVCMSKSKSSGSSKTGAAEPEETVAVASDAVDGPTAMVDSSDSDEEDEDSDSRPSAVASLNQSGAAVGSVEASNLQTDSESAVTTAKIRVPLMDYIGNVMKFIEAILSNNSTDDHCRAFIQQGGVEPLLKLLSLPNLTLEFPVSSACLQVATVARIVLTLAREGKLLQNALNQFSTNVLPKLEPLLTPLVAPGGSLLVEELLNLSVADLVATATNTYAPNSASTLPLMKALSDLKAYLVLFTQLCKSNSSHIELKALILQQWVDAGIPVLTKLQEVYRGLAWESSVLLMFCGGGGDAMTTALCFAKDGCDFARSQIERLNERVSKLQQNEQMKSSPSGGKQAKFSSSPMDVDGAESARTYVAEDSAQSSAAAQTKNPYAKLLQPTVILVSKVSRTLSELFSLLVRLCIGGSIRQRRGQQSFAMPPTVVGTLLSETLMSAVSTVLVWKPPQSNVSHPKIWFSYLVCMINFVQSMLFDDRKQTYHLMLYKLYTTGAQNSLFDIFKTAFDPELCSTEAYSDKSIQEYSSEFSEVWLSLVERLCNPQVVGESQHVYLQSGNKPAFSITNYLAATQKMAFDQVSPLWTKLMSQKMSARASELVLTILCHVMKGDEQQKAKAKEEQQKKPPAEELKEMESQLNQQHLQQLMDMGFSRELAVEALIQTTDIHNATEYLLQGAYMRGGQVLSEEEQVQQAIAMSLMDEEPPGAVPAAEEAPAESQQQ